MLVYRIPSPMLDSQGCYRVHPYEGFRPQDVSRSEQQSRFRILKRCFLLDLVESMQFTLYVTCTD
jgi:hypothetical protein